MKTIAAVMRGLHQPLSIETIELDAPAAGEVLIEMMSAGICGSDLHVIDGHFPGPVPGVCGHEGAGIVREVGPGVKGYAVGDHVIHTFVGPCGTCDTCRRGRPTFCANHANADGSLPDGSFRMHDADGNPLGTGLGLGSFSHHTVTPVTNCVVVPEDLDLAAAALISCGVSTGVGAALNVARVVPGSSVAIIGIGGVGAASILGSVLGGAGLVIAVDIHAAKGERAMELGASHFLNAAEQDVAAAIADITGGAGVDAVLLTVDQIRPEQYSLAMEALAPGGIAVQVGASPSDLTSLPISPSIFTRKQVSFTGTIYGGMDPARDALRYADLVRSGRLPVERLMTRSYGLTDINQAFDDLKAGHNIRGMIHFDGL